jgi:hypothetical protein
MRLISVAQAVAIAGAVIVQGYSSEHFSKALGHFDVDGNMKIGWTEVASVNPAMAKNPYIKTQFLKHAGKDKEMGEQEYISFMASFGPKPMKKTPQPPKKIQAPPVKPTAKASTGAATGAASASGAAPSTHVVKAASGTTGGASGPAAIQRMAKSAATAGEGETITSSGTASATGANGAASNKPSVKQNKPVVRNVQAIKRGPTTIARKSNRATKKDKVVQGTKAASGTTGTTGATGAAVNEPVKAQITGATGEELLKPNAESANQRTSTGATGSSLAKPVQKGKPAVRTVGTVKTRPTSITRETKRKAKKSRPPTGTTGSTGNAGVTSAPPMIVKGATAVDGPTGETGMEAATGMKSSSSTGQNDKDTSATATQDDIVKKKKKADLDSQLEAAKAAVKADEEDMKAKAANQTSVEQLLKLVTAATGTIDETGAEGATGQSATMNNEKNNRSSTAKKPKATVKRTVNVVRTKPSTIKRTSRTKNSTNATHSLEKATPNQAVIVVVPSLNGSHANKTLAVAPKLNSTRGNKTRLSNTVTDSKRYFNESENPFINRINQIIADSSKPSKTVGTTIRSKYDEGHVGEAIQEAFGWADEETQQAIDIVHGKDYKYDEWHKNLRDNLKTTSSSRKLLSVRNEDKPMKMNVYSTNYLGNDPQDGSGPAHAAETKLNATLESNLKSIMHEDAVARCANCKSKHLRTSGRK